MKAIRILMAAAMVFVASTAAAQGGQGDGGMRQGGGQGRQNEMLFKGITLTDVQKAKIDSIQAAGRAEMQGMMQGGGMQDSTTRAKMMTMRTKQRADIRAVLTAEQATIYDKNIAEMPAMGGGRRPPNRR